MTSLKEEEEDEIINKAMKIILKRHNNDVSANTLLKYIKKNIEYSYKETEYITEEGSDSYTTKLDVYEDIFEDEEDQKIHDDDTIQYLFEDIIDEISNMDRIFICADKNYINFDMYSEYRDRRNNVTYYIPHKYILLLTDYIKLNKKEINYETFY